MGSDVIESSVLRNSTSTSLNSTRETTTTSKTSSSPSKQLDSQTSIMNSAQRARRIRLKRSRERRQSLTLNRRFSTEGRRTGVRAKENVQKDGQGFDDVNQFFDKEQEYETSSESEQSDNAGGEQNYESEGEDYGNLADVDFDMNMSMGDGEHGIEGSLTPAPPSTGKRSRKVTFSDDSKKRSIEDEDDDEDNDKMPKKNTRSTIEKKKIRIRKTTCWRRITLTRENESNLGKEEYKEPHGTVEILEKRDRGV